MVQKRTGTAAQQPPTAWNPASKAREKREDPARFHKECIENGFMCIPVNISENTTAEQIVSIQNKIKEIDDRANPVHERTGKRIHAEKPYFKYTSKQPDGTIQTYGGGWYLYTGWGHTDDSRYHKNSRTELKGKTPVYFRAKSAVRGSTVPNFSIQFSKILNLYIKFQESYEKPYVIRGGNKTIVVPSSLLQNN